MAQEEEARLAAEKLGVQLQDALNTGFDDSQSEAARLAADLATSQQNAEEIVAQIQSQLDQARLDAEQAKIEADREQEDLKASSDSEIQLLINELELVEVQAREAE